MLVYAGIGSRITPSEVCSKATLIAKGLEKVGFTLRSGGAVGIDTAFENGVKKKENKLILRPTHATPEAIQLASTFHPAWEKCNNYARGLHGRNAMIILGENLDQPAKFVLFWSLSETHGGTAMGVSIAKANGIATFNFKNFTDSEYEAWDFNRQTWFWVGRKRCLFFGLVLRNHLGRGELLT